MAAAAELVLGRELLQGMAPCTHPKAASCCRDRIEGMEFVFSSCAISACWSCRAASLLLLRPTSSMSGDTGESRPDRALSALLRASFTSLYVLPGVGHPGRAGNSPGVMLLVRLTGALASPSRLPLPDPLPPLM